SIVLQPPRLPRDRSGHAASAAVRRRRAHVGARSRAHASLYFRRKPVPTGLPAAAAGSSLCGDATAGRTRFVAAVICGAWRQLHDDREVEEEPEPAGDPPEWRDLPVEQGP